MRAIDGIPRVSAVARAVDNPARNPVCAQASTTALPDTLTQPPSYFDLKKSRRVYR